MRFFTMRFSTLAPAVWSFVVALVAMTCVVGGAWAWGEEDRDKHFHGPVQLHLEPPPLANSFHMEGLSRCVQDVLRKESRRSLCGNPNAWDCLCSYVLASVSCFVEGNTSSGRSVPPKT